MPPSFGDVPEEGRELTDYELAYIRESSGLVLLAGSRIYRSKSADLVQGDCGDPDAPPLGEFIRSDRMEAWWPETWCRFQKE